MKSKQLSLPLEMKPNLFCQRIIQACDESILKDHLKAIEPLKHLYIKSLNQRN